MSKPIITRLFVGSIVAVIAGLVLGFGAVIVAYANNVFVMDGPDVVDVRWTPLAWTTLGLVVVGMLGVIAGAFAGLISWIGALLNTAQLDDKLWFVILLVLGIASFGFIAMIAYVIAGPDGTRQELRRPVHSMT